MEQLYVPLTPCRLFNTRQVGAGGKIFEATPRAFQVTGVDDFGAQGGKAGGCGVPNYATAVSITLTAVNAVAAGYLIAYATGTSVPAAVSATFPVSALGSGNAIVAVGDLGRISVFPRQTTNVYGDVTGYFVPQIQVYMNADGTAYSATTRILSTSKLGTGSYQIQTDRNLQLCSVHANVAGGFYYASAYPSGNSIYVSTWGLSSGNPIAIDLYHDVSVKC